MVNKLKKFVSVCAITTLLVAGLVSAGFAGMENGKNVSIAKVEYKNIKPTPRPALAPAPSPKPIPVPAAAPAPVSSDALYTQNCAGCHGMSMRGRSTTSIQRAINSNRGGMGSYKSLTSAQITAISQY